MEEHTCLGSRDAAELCPVCQVPLRSTCSRCGLWWLKRDVRRFNPSPATESILSLRLSLTRSLRLTLASCLFSGALLFLGLGGALGGAYALTHEPTSALAWLTGFIGVGLGSLVAFTCSMSLVSQLLQAALPGFVEGDGSHLRVRSWTPPKGRNWAFRRTDVLIRRDELRDVGFIVGQDGEPMLFVVHASGHSFATSWSSKEEDVTTVAMQLASWIAHRP